MHRRQVTAVLALLAYVAIFVLVLLAIVDHPGQLVAVWAAILAGSTGVWIALTRRGLAFVLGAAVGVVGIVVAIVLLLRDAALLDVLAIAAVWVLATVSGRYAVGVDKSMLRDVPPPGLAVPRAQRPVLLMNPRSGGGKVVKFDLAREAEQRGIEPIVLGPDDDLATLARDAVARGADLLGMAGGDGSQALVAGIASEHGLPFVCIPAGTRNHLALDLGVDRDDVVGSLDAFIDGFERTIDLASVNGNVFVNNVSLGVYARIVQSDDYRDSKVQTAAGMLPELLGPDADAFDFEIEHPDGTVVHEPCLVLVSNNVYELTRLGGFGSRAPRRRCARRRDARRHRLDRCRPVRRAPDRGSSQPVPGLASVDRRHGGGALGTTDRSGGRRRSRGVRGATAVRDPPGGAERACRAHGTRDLAGARRAARAPCRSGDTARRRRRSQSILT